jgi:hypothetical protein
VESFKLDKVLSFKKKEKLEERRWKHEERRPKYGISKKAESFKV